MRVRVLADSFYGRLSAGTLYAAGEADGPIHTSVHRLITGVIPADGSRSGESL